MSIARPLAGYIVYLTMDVAKFIFNKLLSIQERYPEYFAENDINIEDCVNIHREPPISINVTHEDIPFEIRDEIESIFWID